MGVQDPNGTAGLVGPVYDSLPPLVTHCELSMKGTVPVESASAARFRICRLKPDRRARYTSEEVGCLRW
jgi:hypothetical protein